MSALQHAAAAPTLDDIYRRDVEFVWRTCRYLGVAAADAEDVVHEVFIIVRRRLDEYDPQYSMRSWLAGITRRVVMHHQRARLRSDRKTAAAPRPEVEVAQPQEDAVQHAEAAAILEAFLAELDEDKRDVFVLCELEGLSAPEIALVVGTNVNTVYSRLRAARQGFERKLARLDTIRRREGG